MKSMWREMEKAVSDVLEKHMDRAECEDEALEMAMKCEPVFESVKKASGELVSESANEESERKSCE